MFGCYFNPIVINPMSSSYLFTSERLVSLLSYFTNIILFYGIHKKLILNIIKPIDNIFTSVISSSAISSVKPSSRSIPKRKLLVGSVNSNSTILCNLLIQCHDLDYLHQQRKEEHLHILKLLLRNRFLSHLPMSWNLART